MRIVENSEEVSSLTVAAMDALVVEYFDLIQKDKEQAEAALSVVNKKIMVIELKMAEQLTMLNRDSYRHPRGTITKKVQWSISNPQSDADKKIFFDWLRAKGIYDRYATVNNASLNSLWLAEREAAIKCDPLAELTFNLPGLPPPRSFEGIAKRKGKGT